MMFIWYILIGILAGYLAGKIVRGGGMGLLVNLIVGIIGGVLGGWLFGIMVPTYWAPCPLNIKTVFIFYHLFIILILLI